jgi:hypothetical protein
MLKFFFHIFFSLKTKSQKKFFFLFLISKLFSVELLKKKKRTTLIRGVKGPKKSFNTFFIKEYTLIF